MTTSPTRLAMGDLLALASDIENTAQTMDELRAELATARKRIAFIERMVNNARVVLGNGADTRVALAYLKGIG